MIELALFLMLQAPPQPKQVVYTNSAALAIYARTVKECKGYDIRYRDLYNGDGIFIKMSHIGELMIVVPVVDGKALIVITRMLYSMPSDMSPSVRIFDTMRFLPTQACVALNEHLQGTQSTMKL